MPSQELATLPTAKDQDFEPFWLRHALSSSVWELREDNIRMQMAVPLLVRSARYCVDLGRGRGRHLIRRASSRQQDKKARSPGAAGAASESTSRPHETTPTRTKSALPTPTLPSPHAGEG